MRDFLTNLSSTSWWIGVVLVGIVLNVLAAYVKPWIDESMAHFSTKRRSRLEAKSRIRQDLTDSLRSNQHSQVLYAIQNLRTRLQVVTGLLMSVLLFILSLFVKSSPAALWPFAAGATLYRIVDFTTMGLGALTMLLSVNRLRDAIDETAILWAARHSGRDARG